METRTAFCPACDRTVEVIITDSPLHGGTANVPDATSVCLDFGTLCTSTTCPVFGLPRVVMGVRLARLEPDGARLPSHAGRCEGCGQVVELRDVDREHGVCPECGTVNQLVILRLDDDSRVSVLRMTPDA